MIPGYGEEAVRQMCKWFGLPAMRIIDTYCDFDDSGSHRISTQIQGLGPYLHGALWPGTKVSKRPPKAPG